ncbi:MAG: DUF7507 domain-containing protein, partial [Paracoccaceae bacterium]
MSALASGALRATVNALRALVLAGATLGGGQALAQSAIEFDSTGGTPQTGPKGQTLTTYTVTMRNNSDNPTGTSFAGVSPGPVPVATFTLTNQQYTMPTSEVSSGTAVFMGTQASSAGTSGTYYAALSSIGSPANAYFTSPATAAAGTGIGTVTNYGGYFVASPYPLRLANASATGRHQMADLLIDFNQPMTNPVVHLSAMGGVISITGTGGASKGFSTEFDFLPGQSVGATSITRLSGNGVFSVSGDQISNGAASMSASCSAGAAACGSIRVNGTSVTRVALRVYLRSTSNTPWNFSVFDPVTGNTIFIAGPTSGDAFMVSVSGETADMSPVLSGLPAQIVPGTTYTGLTLTCTNAGPNTARGATCAPSADVGTISALSCTPAVPVTALSETSPNNRVVCTFSYTVPVATTATQAIFTGQTGANNDRNGGIDGTAGNNQTTATVPIRSTADFAVTKTDGVASIGSGTATTYTVTVTNNGPSAVTGAVLSDPAATGLTKTAVACSATPGQCTTAPTVAQLEGGSFALPALASGQTYQITIAANVTATSGSVANAASIAVPAGTTDPTPGNNSATDTNTILLSSIALIKAATFDDVNGDGVANVGDAIDYAFTVSNTGGTTLTNVTISDPLPGIVISGGPIVTLASGAADSTTFTARYLLTQTDINGGEVENQATATGTTPGGTPVTDLSDESGTGAGDNDPTAVPITAAPGIALVKTGVLADTNGNGRQDAGDTITYAFTVTNTGNVTLTDISVTDPLPGTTVSGGPLASLLPGASDSTTFTATHVLTQAEVNAGGVTNQATASGDDPGGDPVTDLSDESGTGAGDNDPTAVPITAAPGIALVKTATYVDQNGNGVTDAGDRITYAFAVTNTGNVTLTGITLADPLPGITLSGGPIATLAPGATNSTTFTGSYTITLTDMNTGEVQNQATATGTTPTAGTVSDLSGSATTNDAPTVVPLAQTPRIALVKTGSFVDVNGNGRADEGDRIDYAFTVTNTGTVTLTDISVTDPLPGIVVSGGPLASLVPGAANSTTFTASYTLTQDDVDTGGVTNQATVTGDDPGGDPVTDLSDESGTTAASNDPTTVPLPASGGIALVKTSAVVDTNANGRTDAGDTITYAFAVTNTGNVTLSAITLADPLPGVTLTGGPIASLAPGATDSTTFTGSYTITQTNMDTGEVVNQATATGTTPGGGTVSDPSGSTTGNNTPTTTPLAGDGRVALVKSGAFNDINGNGRPDAGETVTYIFTVTNTGTVTLRNIDVTDPMMSPVLVGTIPGPLAPGGSSSITETYPVTQADIDAGEVQNQATASGDDPQGNPVTDLSDESGTGTGDNDPTVVPLGQLPSMTVDKRLSAASPTSFSAVGTVLSYDFVIRNTGNTTITGPFGIDDSLIPAGITCPAGPLAPGATLTCTGGSYTTVQADIDAGGVTNTASAYTGPQATPVLTSTNTDSVTVPSTRTPALTVDKSTTQSAPADFILGNTITYSYLVTNVGNQTLTAPVTVADNLIPSVSCPALPVGGLLPGDTLTCTGSYTIGVNDIALGSATNNARASSGAVISPPDTVTIPDGASPALSIDKTLVGISTGTPTFEAVGDVITYNFRVTNSGNASFVRDVVVSDDVISPISGDVTCFDSQGGTVTFAPGAVVDCQATYTVTQADLDAGGVQNVASAASIFAPASPTPLPVQSPTDTLLVNAATGPALTVNKVADPLSGAGLGDTITYTIEAENTGNQTLSNVTIDDPMLAALTCAPAAPVTLAPGDVLSCQGSYVVTQADIDNEEIVNTATAEGFSPQGVPVDATGGTTHVPEVPAAGLTVVKSSVLIDSPANGRPDEGDIIRYTFRVTNTGNQTLTNVVVTDGQLTPSVVGTVATLAPGAVRVFTADYVLTAGDLDSTLTGIENTVDATADDPDGVQVSDIDTVTTPLPRDGRITLV